MAANPSDNLYRFHNPVKLTSGVAALDHLPMELDGHDAVRPMVLAHKGPGTRGRLRRLLKAFRDSGMTLVVYDRLSPEASLEEVRQLSGHFRIAGCDALLALGQGALMHQAKALRLFLCGEAASESGDLPDPAAPDMAAGPPLFWLPTGPGAGDELGGRMAVGEHTLRHPALRPQMACVDRRLLDPGDRGQLLDSVLVALVNAVEVCLEGGANPFAAVYAEAAVKTITATLTPEGFDQKRSAVLLALTNAAVWAGCAREMAPPGLAHRLGRALSEKTDAGAGVCMALCLPAVVDRALQKETRLAAELLHLLGDAELYSLTAAELRRSRCVNLLREGWYTLCENWPDELPAGIRETGISRDTLGAAAEAAHREAPEAALDILEQSWTLVAPQRLQALPPVSAVAVEDAERSTPPMDPNADRGAQDAPAELL